MPVKKVIREFLKDKKRKVLVREVVSRNSMYDWPRVRFPVKVVFNYIVVRFCSILPLPFKTFLYRHVCGISIGREVAIAPEADFDSFYPELISIDDNVIIGMRASIYTHEFMQGALRLGRVHIGEGAVIGAHTVVRSGVTIGNGAVIGMCSFVNKDVPPGEVWGGVPAKRIKKKSTLKLRSSQ